MKVWELVAKLEGADPEAEVVIQDGEVSHLLDRAVVEPPAERSQRVTLVVSA